MATTENATGEVEAAGPEVETEGEINTDGTSEALAPEDISMDMCMEVVYSFKCKFCAFTTSTAQDITSHVQSMHFKDRKAPLLLPSMKLQLSPSKSVGDGPSVGDTPEVSVAAASSELQLTSEQPDLSQDVQLQMASESQSVEQGTLVVEPQHLEQAVVEELVIENTMDEPDPDSVGKTYAATQTVIDTESDFHIQDNARIQVEVISRGDVQPVGDQLQETLNGQVYEILNFSARNEVGTAGDAAIAMTAADVVTVQAPETKQAVLASAEAEGMAASAAGQEGASEVPLEMLHASAIQMEPVTKEVYICGQCNEGFATMDECKQHMSEIHDISFANSNVEIMTSNSEAVQLPNHKVSVGTQATGYKKPGRKRKRQPGDEPPVIVEGEAAMKEPKEDDEDMQHESEEEREVTYTRSGRKAQRIPKALREDYVVPKRKYRKRATPPRSRSEQGVGRLRCPTEWCKAKFTTEESLKIHRDCHDEKDDIYTPFKCPRCTSPFTAWKVLRMHLWKEHSVDLDLFKCPSCEYRIDTLSKLELHAKTHGSARPYVCVTCGKSFKQQTQLANHQVSVPNALYWKPVVCMEFSLCDNVLWLPWILPLCMLVFQTCHLSEAEKPANVWYNRCTCDICGRTYCNRRSLKIHVEVFVSAEP